MLGASGLTVGLVAGLGELLGYGLRLASGFISDRTRKYWVITIVVYAINLFAVPALALANHWQLAAALMIAERIGKALRSSPRDVMLSYATQQMGRGVIAGILAMQVARVVHRDKGELLIVRLNNIQGACILSQAPGSDHWASQRAIGE